MLKNTLVFLCFIFFYSCGTDNLKPDNSIRLKGPIKLLVSLSNSDSIMHQGESLKISFQFPDSIVSRDGVIIRNIVSANCDMGPMADKIDTITKNAYAGDSKNFTKCNGDCARAAIYLRKGSKYCEDTYICRDVGVVWFSQTLQADNVRFWTADGKEYTIPVTYDFNVPDRHTEMLVRYCPSIEAYLNVMLDQGFGHYCFKVVP